MSLETNGGWKSDEAIAEHGVHSRLDQGTGHAEVLEFRCVRSKTIR